jgi:2-C-methyl-D-erythritol 4-phosphate cytidylyltransferase
VPLAGRPMVEWSIAALRGAACVRSIVVACPPGHLHELAGEDVELVEGGATRARSVANALRAVETELVAIHDAARPLLTPQLVEAVIATLLADPGAAGAIAATPVADTIKRATEGSPPTARWSRSGVEGPPNNSISVEETVDRGSLWAAQTPQVFRVGALRRALDADPARVEGATDEAMLVEAAGGRVLIHPAAAENPKVTTPADLRVAGLLLDR